MSAIPPNWLSSIIQSHGAQQRATDAKQKEAAEEVQRTSDTRFAEKLQNVISNEDEDAAVYADAEGAGGQGRAFADSEQPEETEEREENNTDTEDHNGIDFQA